MAAVYDGRMRSGLAVALILASCSFDLSRSPHGDRAPAREAAVDGRATDQARDAPPDDRRDHPTAEKKTNDGPPKLEYKLPLDVTALDKAKDLSKPPDSLSADALAALVTWKESQTTAKISCSVLGGGADCSAGVLSVLWPDAASKQAEASCTSGTGKLYAACAGPAFPGAITHSKASNAKNAYCAPGYRVVGGGCKCASNAILSSYPIATPPAEGWYCACESYGNPTEVVALCATGVTTTIEAYGCSPGQVLLGGGCHCQNGLLRQSYPWGSTWSCSCNNGNASVYSICAP
jgi:hypothetical protein